MIDPDSKVLDTGVVAQRGQRSPAPSEGGRPEVESHLDYAVYYLRHGCEPCAERHFDRARRNGASEEQIEAARTLGRETQGHDIV
ncbi:MAG: carboxymuconolactone decarboxylase family protein [Acidimicrobiales bacterium]|jgi:hypothetical protein